jgi:hypothetical protein
MKFVSLIIREGVFHWRFDFTEGVNIIHSSKNSVGKTTLLRILMFALGYPIPNTRGINFNHFELEAEVAINGDATARLIRDGDSMVVFQDENETFYSLPSDLTEIQKILFGVQNQEVLENLLGAFYVDQEKGWTLLNRGKAIGNIHFSLVALIRGLSDRSSNELAVRLASTKRELQKYRHMLDIAQYQAEINALGEAVIADAPSDELEKALEILYCERKPLSNELQRLRDVIRKNTAFQNFISNYHLQVQSPTTDEIIPVNESTLCGFRDDTEYLRTKRKLAEQQLVDLDRKISVMQGQVEQEASLLDIRTSIQAFDADVSKMKIDALATERVIRKLEKERKELEEALTSEVKRNNPLVSQLHQFISEYAQELGVDERYMRPNEDYVFTSDLKSLSGAIFHKIVFAFKMSYVRLIRVQTGLVLPIVLDSPSGREVDRINVADMMKILSRDFSEHQIIIASINLYDFSDANVIELQERLLM